MATTNAAVGRDGEDRVANWYERHGYQVIARNWRNREGEIDIVAAAPGVVVVCEVKARSRTDYGGPTAAVTAIKQARLRRLAIAFLVSSGVHAREVRFDVACVVNGAVEVIEAAF